MTAPVRQAGQRVLCRAAASARVFEQEGLFSRSYASRAASAARLEPPPLQGREGQGLQKRFVDARGVHARHMWVGDERVDAPA